MNTILYSTLSTLNVGTPVYAYTNYGNNFYSVYQSTNQAIRKYQFSDYTYSWEVGSQVGFTLPTLYFDGTNLWAFEYNSSTGVQNLLKIDDSTGQTLYRTTLATYVIYNPSFSTSKIEPAGIACDGTNLWVIVPKANSGSPTSTQLYKVDPSDASIINTYEPGDYKSSLTFFNNRLWYLSSNTTYAPTGWTDDTVHNLIQITTLSNDPPTFTTTALPSSPGTDVLVTQSLFFDNSYCYVWGIKYHYVDSTSFDPYSYGISKVDQGTLSITTTYFDALSSDLIKDSNVFLTFLSYDSSTKNFFLKNNTFSAVYRFNNLSTQTLNGTDTNLSPEMEIWPLIDSNDVYFVKVIDAETYDVIRAGNSIRANLRTEIPLTIDISPQLTTEESTETDSAITPEKSSCHDFSFTAIKDYQYTFSVDSSVIGSTEWDDTLSPGTLPLISVLDSNENELVVTTIDTDAHAKTLTWVAPSNGAYHVRVRTAE